MIAVYLQELVPSGPAGSTDVENVQAGRQFIILGLPGAKVSCMPSSILGVSLNVVSRCQGHLQRRGDPCALVQCL